MAELVENFKDLADDKVAIQDTKEIIVNKAFFQPTDSMFTIVPGIKGGQQVAAMKGFEYVTKKSAGCGGSGISPEFPAFSQHWNPTLQEVKIEYCYSDFEASFLQWKLKNGYDRKDLTSTTIALFIQDLVSDAIALDMQRIVLMGNKDMNALNVLTDETAMLPFYTTIDKGLIPTLVYLKTLPEFADNFVTLSKNTGFMADQLNLSATYGKEIYESITEGVYDFDGEFVLSSNRLFENYKKWAKNAHGIGIQSVVDNTINGISDPKIDGYPVVAAKHYDRWAAKDFVTEIEIDEVEGDTIYKPHFALFTRKEYLQVGVDDEAALSDLRLEYVGGSEEKFWIKANYMLDFKMVNPYAFKAAI